MKVFILSFTIGLFLTYITVPKKTVVNVNAKYIYTCFRYILTFFLDNKAFSRLKIRYVIFSCT